jgi:hypothetical protein
MSPVQNACHFDLPTRSRESFARDDKGKGNGSIEAGSRTETFFIALGGPPANDSSGRDDKVVCAMELSSQTLTSYQRSHRSARNSAEASAAPHHSLRATRGPGKPLSPRFLT